MKVRGRFGRGCAWIHLFIGDTAGNNTWLGHYNGSGKLKRPYIDYRCTFRMMDAHNPHCTYITLDDTRAAKRQKMNARTEKGGKRSTN